MEINVNEHFLSLQGEGPDQGRITAFIRLAGCNLNCVWCDTKYAMEEKAKVYDVEVLASEVISLFRPDVIRRVCITGGEPGIQIDSLHVLVDYLLVYNCEVSIETNGSIDVAELPEVPLVIDYKLPSSGEIGSFNDNNFEGDIEDWLKFVIGSRVDMAYIDEYQLIEKSRSYEGRIIISVTDDVKISEVAEWIIKRGYDVCLQKQLHKIIWGNKRGV